MEGTIRDLGRTIEPQYTEIKRVEASLQGYMREISNKILQIYTLKIQIEELERKLHEQKKIYQQEKGDWTDVVMDLRDLVHSLQHRLGKMDREKKRVENTLRDYIQNEDRALRTATGRMRYFFNHLIRGNKIWLSVFIVSIFSDCIYALINIF